MTKAILGRTDMSDMVFRFPAPGPEPMLTDLEGWTKFYEFGHLIEGQITITPDGGTPVTLRPGDAFTVEPGFAGTWTIEKPVRKHFCIKLR